MSRGLVFVLALVLLLACWPILEQGYAEYALFDEGALKNKKVFVAGASTGIGEEIAYRYARAGAHVALVARRRPKLEEVAARCRELGAASALVVPTDLGQAEQVRQAMHEAVASFGGELDIVVLNHIVGRFGWWFKPDGTPSLLAEEKSRLASASGESSAADASGETCRTDGDCNGTIPTDQQQQGSREDEVARSQRLLLEDARSMSHVNYNSYLELATQAMPQLVQSGRRQWASGGGQLIIVGSAVARAGASVKVMSYAPTKYAVHGLADALRIELKYHEMPVSVTHCTIGEIATDNQMRDTAGQLHFTKEVLNISGSPAETAHAIVVGGATRRREIFHPLRQGLQVMTLLRALAPSLVDAMLMQIGV